LLSGRALRFRVNATLRPGARQLLLRARDPRMLSPAAAAFRTPEIAERLFISRRTVEHHVSHILSKLDLRNRAEAAAYATSARGSGHVAK
jgi:ATP/maltotriose-dependent transcriptional regulator MalT